jgi:proline iminopeptidase
LFPALMPYSTGFLDVDSGHSLYWEQSGNPDGVPVLFVHGGPGGGASATDRRFFNPEYYRIVILDQRGAGRSHPFGSLEKNTLAHLTADIEALRRHLNIRRWHLFGGSWGSTLALAYAQAHPQACLGLILRGIFLMEQAEIDWFLHGMKMIFPEAWDQFIAPLPERDREKSRLLDAYYARLTGSDTKAAMEAAVAWCLYEVACASLLPNYETITTEEQKKQALAIARIEAHYFRHEAIAPEKSLLRGIDKIRAIPTTIIQGRYDVICPIITAHRLHLAWPEADYVVVADGGHSALDPAIRSRLIEATENARTIR